MVIVLSCSKKHYTEVDFGIHDLYFFTCIKKIKSWKKWFDSRVYNALDTIHVKITFQFVYKVSSHSSKIQSQKWSSRLHCHEDGHFSSYRDQALGMNFFCKTVHDPFILQKYNLISKSDTWKRKTLIQFLLQIGNLGPTCTAAAASS